MSKVKSLGKSQFSHKLSFLSCFRSEISGKFIPYSIQVHHNYLKASLEVGTSNVLSGSGKLLEANQWPWDAEQRPPPCFKVHKFTKFNSMNIFICVHTANFVLHKLKHPFGVFSHSLSVSGRPQAACQSLKAHWRCQLLWMPWGDCGGPGCCRGWIWR